MKRSFIIGTLAFLVLCTAAPALAAGPFQFQPIISSGALPLPTTSLCDYLNAIFKLSITIAVVLAVIMIVIDGFKYMTSEAVGNKKDALGGIRSALGGLILLLASYLILFIINPQILSLSVFSPNGGTLGGCALGQSTSAISVTQSQIANQNQTVTAPALNISSLLNTLPTVNYPSAPAATTEWCYTAAPSGQPTTGTVCFPDATACTTARAADPNATGLPCLQPQPQ